MAHGEEGQAEMISKAELLRLDCAYKPLGDLVKMKLYESGGLE